MAFKINISTSEGKTYKLEAESPGLMQKKLGEVVKGQEVSPDLAGYELEITGLSDKSGFISVKDVEGIGLKKVLLDQGTGMHKKPKGDKKKVRSSAGLRLRKTVRGNTIGEAIVQINTKVLKEGEKKLSEVFPDQNAAPAPAEPEAKEEAPQNANPESEPKEQAPTEANPEKEPKESEASKEEKANPDEEPKA